MEIEPKIFTIVKTKLIKKFKNEFPNMYITSTEESRESPIFPTVYIQMMNGSEKGVDFEPSKINSLECTFQIEVSTNTTKDDASRIMQEIINIMKTMLFTVIASPEFNSGSVFRQVTRVRRVISSDDVI